MALPWFSQKDDKLLMSVSNRDPLGLIPIWTSVGRELIPNLASGVQRVEGVQTVILAYYLYSVLEDKNAFAEKWAFRRFFRVMEQLCEKFMYDYLKDAQVEDGGDNNNRVWCYGIRILPQSGFKVSKDNTLTIANGLYQFYRGACRRSGIIAGDLEDLNDEYNRLLSKLSVNDSTFLKELEKFLYEVDRGPAEPAKFIKDHYQELKNFYKNSEFLNLLKRDLLKEGVPRETAKLYYRQKDNQNRRDAIKQIFALCEKEFKKHQSEVHHEISEKVTNMTHCEDWLCGMRLVFDWLLRRHNYSLADLAEELEKNKPAIASAAESFDMCKQPQETNTERFQAIKELSERCRRNNQEFLTAFVDHHTEIANNRGDAPMMFFDNGHLIITDPLSDPETWEEDFEGLLGRWNNDYYFTAASKLYQQLFVWQNEH